MGVQEEQVGAGIWTGAGKEGWNEEQGEGERDSEEAAPSV